MPKTLQSASAFRRHPFKVKDKRRRRQRTEIPKNVIITTRKPSTSPARPSEKPSRVPPEEPRKKIANCSGETPGVVSRRRRRRGRPPSRPPAATDARAKKSESDSEEDDVPASFSDVIKLVTQKVQETQNEIKSIEDSFNNYKTGNEEPTILLMKFYASVPKLHEKVSAGVAFDDDLIETVFEELFPASGVVMDRVKSSRFAELLTRDSKSPVAKNKIPAVTRKRRRKSTQNEDEKPTKKRRRRRKVSD